MKITYFNPSYETLTVRLYLMMAVVIASFYAGVPFLAIIAVPIFIAAMIGLKIEKEIPEVSITKNLSNRPAKTSIRA